MNKSRLLSLILALVFIITSIPMNLSLAQTYPTEGVTLELIYFRQSPKNAIKPQVEGCETIAKGEKVTIMCESDGFYLLNYKGYYGFARMRDIHIGELPTSEPTKTPAVTPTPIKTPTPTKTPSTGSLTVYGAVYSGATLELVYFRQNPASATKPRVKGCETIPAGREVYVIGVDNGFYYIKYNGYYGYARQQDIRVYGVAQNQPSVILPSENENEKTPAPINTPPLTGESSGPKMYSDEYIGKTKEIVYFRQNPASATKPRVKGCESIPSNKQVTVLGESGDFYYISYKGYYGYARKQDISVTGKVGAPTPTPKPTEPAMYADKYTGATLEKVYFRKNPTSATTPRVSGCETIPSGKEIIVLGEYGDFYYISYKGYYGYARKADVRIYGKVIPPTPTPKPTPDPTTAPIPNNVTLTSEQKTKWNSVTSNLIKRHDKNPDTRGWIYIPTTKNINYPIMYSSSFYYDDHTPDKKSSTRGSIYSYHDSFGGINTIAGHNSRESHTMFHELHHIQARLLGRKTCEGCGESVTYIDTNNLVFNVCLGGYSVWQLFAMYETGAKENKDVLTYNTSHPNLSVSGRRTWIDYQLSRSQKNFNVQVGDTEPLLVLVTCGDNYDSSTAQSRLYMFLKAVY